MCLERVQSESERIQIIERKLNGEFGILEFGNLEFGRLGNDFVAIESAAIHPCRCFRRRS